MKIVYFLLAQHVFNTYIKPMKVKLTLTVDAELLQKAREILRRAPKKSVSSFLEEKLAELIQQNEVTK